MPHNHGFLERERYQLDRSEVNPPTVDNEDKQLFWEDEDDLLNVEEQVSDNDRSTIISNSQHQEVNFEFLEPTDFCRLCYGRFLFPSLVLVGGIHPW